MRWSIRNQILIPLILVQAAAVCALTVAAATLAARRSERQVIDRLDGVVGALGQANFPYTEAVLARMRGLSGAEFVAYDDDGRVAATSLPNLDATPPPPSSGSLPPTARLDSLGASPTLLVGGTRYFAVPLPPSGGPRAPTLLVLYPETSWRQARREAAAAPLVFGGGSLLLLLAVTSWVAHRIGRRLQVVGAQVARIASGDFEGFDPDPGGRRDEVAELAHSVNVLCHQLRDMSRTIQQSERTRLLAQLAAGLAHQMRNSLTGARMSVQLHARRSPAASGDRSLEVALRQLAMTEEQVKGLLALGRVERREATACDLRALLREVALMVGPACEHAKVTLDARAGGEPLEVLAEEPGLRAAILNLTLNAVEAAGRGGTVRLEARREGASAAVAVSDSGPGPPPEIAGALFEPFVTGKPEGVGLGLALAQQVAAGHGGTLSWERAGGETCFRLALPRAEVAPELEAAALEDTP